MLNHPAFSVSSWGGAPQTAKIHWLDEDAEPRWTCTAGRNYTIPRLFFFNTKKIKKTYLHDAQVKEESIRVGLKVGCPRIAEIQGDEEGQQWVNFSAASYPALPVTMPLSFNASFPVRAGLPKYTEKKAVPFKGKSSKLTHGGLSRL